MTDRLSSLHLYILEKIRTSPSRQISYAEWMKYALYHPEWGYYQQERVKLGKKGDFYTNAHVGNIYGKVLAHTFLRLFAENNSDHSKSWQIIEIGAGDGRMIEQIIEEMKTNKINPNQIEFVVVETSSYHRKMQQERLQQSDWSIQWVSSLKEVSANPFTIVYSNELIDAFPVHVLEWEQEEWKEVYITELNDTFVESKGSISKDEITQALPKNPPFINKGQRIEINIAAKKWIEEVAHWMEEGFVITIDYGGTFAELMREDRHKGTLRGYMDHQLVSPLLGTIGDMDLTAHVNFEHLIYWGKEAGLHHVSYQTQAEFLLEQGILTFLPPPSRNPFSNSEKERRAIQQLIHPDWMGEAFYVCIQQKG